MSSKLEKIIQNAPKIVEASFHQAVQNAERVPESSFSMESAKSSRRIEMWYVPPVIVCRHQTKLHGTKYFATPLSNCIYFNFMPDETA